MFNSDKPIESITEDILGRGNAAKELGKNIFNYNSKDSLIIGIIGKWGSGKTSFINLVLESLPKEKYIIVKFNPWNISTRKQLISDFFLQLYNDIGLIDDTEASKEIAKNLKFISQIFKPLSLIPIPQISLLASGTGKILESVGNIFDEYSKFQEQDLNKIKQKLNKVLEKLDKKILIVIDDIDRLTDEEIREIFQLVKSIADFKNTIYLLSYDDVVVKEALDKLQNNKGEEYLEKIVQVPIILPFVSKREINKIFLNRLEQILEISEENFDESYFGKLYNNGFINNLESIRDIERYINVFNFGVNTVKEELNLCDYMAITLFKVFEPRFYKYIQEHEQYFVGVKFGGEFEINSNEEKKLIKQKLDEEFENLKKINKENAKNLIKTIFPKINGLYNNTMYDYNFISEWNSTRRIASPKYFISYFKLDFSKDEISRVELKRILDFSSKDELKQIFNVKNSKRLELLERVLEIIQNLKVEKRVAFLQFILSIADELEDEEVKGIFSFMEKVKYRVTRIFYKILSLTEDKFELIKKVFDQEDSSLEITFSILEEISKTNQDYEISSENLEILKNLLLERILKKSIEAKYIPKNFAGILFCLKRIGDIEKAKALVNNYLKNKNLLLDFIKSFIEKKVIEKNYKIIEEKYIVKNNIEIFIEYDILIKMVENTFPNPTLQEKQIIDYLKNARIKVEG